MPAISIARRTELVVRVDAKVPALVDVNHEIVSFNTDGVDDVLIDNGHQFLDSVLRDAFVHDERAVNHAMREVQVQPADGFAVFEDCVALRLLCADLSFEIESWHVIRRRLVIGPWCSNYA